MKSSAKTKPLKVFGAYMMSKGPDGTVQRRVVVACTSKKEAAGILQMSMYEANQYVSITGNGYEVGAALSCPGIPVGEMTEPGRMGRNVYRRLDMKTRTLVGEDISDRG
jgi:hypothetical protein